jgi:hypothetical protein
VASATATASPTSTDAPAVIRSFPMTLPLPVVSCSHSARLVAQRTDVGNVRLLRETVKLAGEPTVGALPAPNLL